MDAGKTILPELIVLKFHLHRPLISCLPDCYPLAAIDTVVGNTMGIIRGGRQLSNCKFTVCSQELCGNYRKEDNLQIPERTSIAKHKMEALRLTCSEL